MSAFNKLEKWSTSKFHDSGIFQRIQKKSNFSREHDLDIMPLKYLVDPTKIEGGDSFLKTSSFEVKSSATLTFFDGSGKKVIF